MLHFIKKYRLTYLFTTAMSLVLAYSVYHFETCLSVQELLIFTIAVYFYIALFVFSILNKILNTSKSEHAFFHWDLF